MAALTAWSYETSGTPKFYGRRMVRIIPLAWYPVPVAMCSATWCADSFSSLLIFFSVIAFFIVLMYTYITVVLKFVALYLCFYCNEGRSGQAVRHFYLHFDALLLWICSLAVFLPIESYSLFSLRRDFGKYVFDLI